MCRNLPLCGRARRGSQVRLPKEENAWSRQQRLFVENVGKNRRKPVMKNIPDLGLVFTFEEGISTSHVCPKGQQP